MLAVKKTPDAMTPLLRIWFPVTSTTCLIGPFCLLAVPSRDLGPKGSFLSCMYVHITKKIYIYIYIYHIYHN